MIPWRWIFAFAFLFVALELARRYSKVVHGSPREFVKGQRVRYIPRHANGDRHHPDCKNGVVKRLSSEPGTVFVIYDNLVCMMTTGDEPYTAASTRAADLIHI